MSEFFKDYENRTSPTNECYLRSLKNRTIVWKQVFCRSTHIISRYSQGVFQFTEHQKSLKKVKIFLLPSRQRCWIVSSLKLALGVFLLKIEPYFLFSPVFTQNCIAFGQSELIQPIELFSCVLLAVKHPLFVWKTKSH
jgi:hypothetical protein